MKLLGVDHLMPNKSKNSELDSFIAITEFFQPFWIKKMEFIYNNIKNYSEVNHKMIEDLNVLDVGCGDGGIALAVASLGCSVTAFDINIDNIENIKRKIKKNGKKNLKAFVDDGCIFNDGKVYDIIIAIEVFEHVMNPKMLAQNISNRMANGSYFIISVPNGYGAWELQSRFVPFSIKKYKPLRRLLGLQPYPKEVFPGFRHVQFYTKRKVLDLFSNLDLSLVSRH